VPVEPGVQIRQAGPADLDTVVRLGMETIRYDAHFGTVIERPETPAALRGEAAQALAVAEPWVWLAERDGDPFGLLYAERPEFAGWVAPMVRGAPVAYLELMEVLPGERGRGVAAALVGELHRAADESGVEVTLLHYEQVNPLSGPFWHQQGYRPLWTSWEARPASTLR
jgi:GNAT superfamily N-acetyltransferase